MLMPRKITLEVFVLAMGIVEPLFTLPQLYTVWCKHQTDGVSLITWLSFTIAAAIWLVYGVSIKSRPLVVSYALYTILNGLVVLGIIIR